MKKEIKIKELVFKIEKLGYVVEIGKNKIIISEPFTFTSDVDGSKFKFNKEIAFSSNINDVRLLEDVLSYVKK